MARPQKVTGEQIARVAREAFLELGPGISVDVVAKRLGVSHAALFHRVGSKQQLLTTALAPGPPTSLDAFAEGPHTGAPVQRQLETVLASLLEYFARRVPALVVLRAAGAPIAGDTDRGVPPPVELRRRLARWLKAANRSALCAVDEPAAVAEALLGALEARCFNAYVGGDAFITGSDRAFIRKLVRGLVPELGARS